MAYEVINSDGGWIVLDQSDCGGGRMRLAPEEPAAGPWRVEPLAGVITALLQRTGPITGRATILAIDGRSSSG